MRFFIVLSLLVGVSLGSPIGQVADEVVTTSEPIVRDDIVDDSVPGTTVIVEIQADETVTAAIPTERARQGGTEGEDSDEGGDEPTTVSPVAVRNRPEPVIPQPFANASDFLAEYQFSSQFNLGPAQSVDNVAAPVAPVAAVAVPAVGAVAPESVVIPLSQNTNTNAAPPLPPASGAVAPGEDEDEETESEEATEGPAAPAAGGRQNAQQQQQVVEESDSDNEITNDDVVVTTVKSFAAEYEYTVQQLNSDRSDNHHDEAEIPTEPSPPSTISNDTISHDDFEEGGLDDLDFEPGVLSDGEGRAACECGRLPFRVPIDSEADLNLRPWTVAIVRGGLIAGGRPHCAGVLVNDRYVLTSASCMDGLHPSGIQVWLTAHSTLENHNLKVGTTKLGVQDIVMHPNYKTGSKDNDIALVKMADPVDIITSSSYFTPVCIPSAPNVDYSGRSATIFGWGNARINRICSTRVPVLGNHVCKRDSTYGETITNNMMCAGFLTPGHATRIDDCIADAGSPLTVDVNGRTSLIGVTSWGYEYHQRGHSPTVYTRVSLYSDWILHNTQDADWCQT